MARTRGEADEHGGIVLRDVHEKNLGNEPMPKGRPNVGAFQVCPITGAYYFRCAPDSALVHPVVERLLTGGAEDVRHYILEHIKPVQEQARRMIQSYRFFIPELQGVPGRADAE